MYIPYVLRSSPKKMICLVVLVVLWHEGIASWPVGATTSMPLSTVPPPGATTFHAVTVVCSDVGTTCLANLGWLHSWRLWNQPDQGWGVCGKWAPGDSSGGSSAQLCLLCCQLPLDSSSSKTPAPRTLQHRWIFHWPWASPIQIQQLAAMVGLWPGLQGVLHPNCLADPTMVTLF